MNRNEIRNTSYVDVIQLFGSITDCRVDMKWDGLMERTVLDSCVLQLTLNGMNTGRRLVCLATNKFKKMFEVCKFYGLTFK